MEGRVRVSAHARPDEVTLSCLPAFLQHIHMQVPATTTPLLWKRFAVQQSTQITSQYAIGPGVYPNIPHVTCLHAVANSHQACLRHGRQVVPFTRTTRTSPSTRTRPAITNDALIDLIESTEGFDLNPLLIRPNPPPHRGAGVASALRFALVLTERFAKFDIARRH
jgi:hypothetical protein